MKKKYQIFVSSTFLDLKKVRWQIRNAIINMGHIPLGMEIFPAANDEQWDIITQEIDQCDYFVLVVGGKYGTPKPNSNQSYTYAEYLYAKEKNIPILAFIKPAKKGEDSRLTTFKDFIKNDKKLAKIIDWTVPDKALAPQVALSLSETFEKFPRDGLIRADSIITSFIEEAKAKVITLNLMLKEIKLIDSETNTTIEEKYRFKEYSYIFWQYFFEKKDIFFSLDDFHKDLSEHISRGENKVIEVEIESIQDNINVIKKGILDFYWQEDLIFHYPNNSEGANWHITAFGWFVWRELDKEYGKAQLKKAQEFALSFKKKETTLSVRNQQSFVDNKITSFAHPFKEEGRIFWDFFSETKEANFTINDFIKYLTNYLHIKTAESPHPITEVLLISVKNKNHNGVLDYYWQKDLIRNPKGENWSITPFGLLVWNELNKEYGK